ncbi:redox-regulated ATPase YchF [Candidatus Woesearchaeota archaeon]|nr:redox-regulated ATPase YchF [Candidatus Woesearchaeota archaeon]
MLVGIVGKPSVGKSTFFKAMTLADVAIASYPFTTIDPNRGFAHVKIKCADNELNTCCNPKTGYCEKGYRFIPVELLDVAGLVPDAHKGKGRGNQFLDELRQADAFIHVVDISGSTNVQGETVPKGNYDPADDIRFLENELDMWYYSIFQKVWKKFSYQTNQKKQNVVTSIVDQFTGLKVTETNVKQVLKSAGLENKNILDWQEKDLKKFTQNLRKTTKKMIIAANKIDMPGAYENYEKIKKGFPDYIIVPCSAECELALKEASKNGLINYVSGEDDFKIIKPDKLNEKQIQALTFIKNNILKKYKSTGVQDVLNIAVFNLLDYIAVYPVENENKLTDSKGNVLPDVMLVKKDSTPEDLAFKIHSDIGNKFNCAISAKTKKRLSKEYKLQNKDIIKIMTS